MTLACYYLYLVPYCHIRCRELMGYIHIFTIRRAKLKLILFAQPHLRFLVTIRVSWVAATVRQTANYRDPVRDSGFSI